MIAPAFMRHDCVFATSLLAAVIAQTTKRLGPGPPRRANAAFCVLAALVILVPIEAIAEQARRTAESAHGQTLSGQELRLIVTGRKLWSRRREALSSSDLTKIVRVSYEFTLSFYLRSDGSFYRECVMHMPEGDQNCGAKEGRTNVGVWWIERDLLCIKGIRHDQKVPLCGSAKRISPTELYIRWENVPPAMDGQWRVK